MTEGEQARLIAWGEELRAVHRRLREALRRAQAAINTGATGAPAHRDLLLLCHGFCTALRGHHQGEDRALFPAIAATHPELGGTLQALERDHELIAQLVDALEVAARGTLQPERLASHLGGIAAIMESHFQYEERQLLTILDTIELDQDPRAALGPL